MVGREKCAFIGSRVRESSKIWRFEKGVTTPETTPRMGIKKRFFGGGGGGGGRGGGGGVAEGRVEAEKEEEKHEVVVKRGTGVMDLKREMEEADKKEEEKESSSGAKRKEATQKAKKESRAPDKGVSGKKTTDGEKALRGKQGKAGNAKADARREEETKKAKTIAAKDKQQQQPKSGGKEPEAKSEVRKRTKNEQNLQQAKAKKTAAHRAGPKKDSKTPKSREPRLSGNQECATKEEEEAAAAAKGGKASKIPRWRFFGRKKQVRARQSTVSFITNSICKTVFLIQSLKALKESENELTKVRCLLRRDSGSRERKGEEASSSTTALKVCSFFFCCRTLLFEILINNSGAKRRSVLILHRVQEPWHPKHGW